MFHGSINVAKCLATSLSTFILKPASTYLRQILLACKNSGFEPEMYSANYRNTFLKSRVIILEIQSTPTKREKTWQNTSMMLHWGESFSSSWCGFLTNIITFTVMSCLLILIFYSVIGISLLPKDKQHMPKHYRTLKEWRWNCMTCHS